MKIVVATTLAAFAMDQVDTWCAWLYSAYALRNTEHDVQYFAAIEIDGRGMEPFTPLVEQLKTIDGEYWRFLLDDGRTEVTTLNRLRHLSMGQNLAVEYATATGADWLLFCAADCRPPDDVFEKLLEMDHPLCGPETSTYCLTGEAVPGYPFPVEEQLISAACIFIRRDVFKRLRWRYDPDEGMSDDPAYRHDADTLLGIKSYVRKDVNAIHYPMSIGPIETRGHDMRVVRND